jgi:hypothetical protein
MTTEKLPRFENKAELLAYVNAHLHDYPKALQLKNSIFAEDIPPQVGRPTLSRLIEVNPSRIGILFDRLIKLQPKIKPWLVDPDVRPYLYYTKVAIPTLLWYDSDFKVFCKEGGKTVNTIIYRRRNHQNTH